MMYKSQFRKIDPYDCWNIGVSYFRAVAICERNQLNLYAGVCVKKKSDVTPL